MAFSQRCLKPEYRLQRVLLFCLILMNGSLASAQSDVRLEQCRKQAREEFSGSRQTSLVGQSAAEQQRLLKKIVRPEVSAYGLAAYLSDVPDPASALAYAFDFDPVPHERLNAGVFLSQRIYNGGEYKLKEEEIRLNARLEEQKIEENLMYIENLVDEVFLGIILAEKEIQIYQKQREVVVARLKDSKALVQEGKLLKKDELQVEMALVELESQIGALEAGELKLRNMLAELTGKEIKSDDRLILPVTDEIEERPDDPAFGQIDIQAQKNQLATRLSKSSALPKIQLFGTAGYGKPGFDSFENQPDWYGSVGLFATVPISAWRDHALQEKILLIESDRLAEYRNTLEKKRNVLEAKYSGEVTRYETLEKQQTLAVEKKEQIRQQMDVLLKEGEASFTDYLAALNDEAIAKVKLEAIAVGKIKEIMKRNRIVVNLSNFSGNE